MATMSVRYVSEKKPGLVESKGFNDRYIAVETIPSADLRFIAFIGHSCKDELWQLYVLDTNLDTIRLLGKAPDPAPFSKDSLETIKSGFDPKDHQDPCMNWQWGYTDALEPSICKFVAPHVLQVSYGKDTCMRRSKTRIMRRWSL